MIVSEYEREFVRLSKYAREWVSTEADTCKRFEEGLNEDIKLLIGILEFREFVVLVDRAHKAEELSKEKKQVERETQISTQARTCAIHAKEDTSAPDVIIGTFSLLNTEITALIDPGSTHSYICTNLVLVKNLPVEFTEIMVKVSNPLGQYVMVDKVCKNCPLMVKGYCFSADLMLLPFDEFDVILGMDWLT
ncbi:E3 ubiquitin-protein ligase RBBP6 [Gossypium australe]|uniref:E3 ubiquitin-protein ligase RBBP6 n=1 Tax=Gossypium australe TaxID=47621 RepID=A0A5B6VB67_9ROSI|nr:E3 ubiquitin-protein ligase RBBP6 [Gossypium australe]